MFIVVELLDLIVRIEATHRETKLTLPTSFVSVYRSPIDYIAKGSNISSYFDTAPKKKLLLRSV